MARAGRFQGLETLEDRVLLSGDDPSLTQFPAATPIGNFDPGTGLGSIAGSISPAGDDDVFSFTPTVTDFVSILADTANEASRTLNSRVEVYRNVNGSPQLVRQGSDNGVLSSGATTDGWAGFIAQAGVTYFVRVLSDAGGGAGATGTYTLYVDARTTDLTPGMTSGEAAATGAITRFQQDVVYKVTTDSNPIFDSLATVGAATPVGIFLDTRLDIYDASGNPLTADSESGLLTNAFAEYRSRQNATFYVRVRSDEINPGLPLQGLGTFNLVVDAAASVFIIDPVTRLGAPAGSTLTDGADTELFSFVAQGTGLTIITGVSQDIPPITDPALHIYSSTGVEIGFNDDIVSGNTTAEIQIQLVSGQRYFLLIETFDDNAGVAYAIDVEAHHTFDPNLPIDDHVSTPENPMAPDFRERFGVVAPLATPIIWGGQRMAENDLDGPLADHSYVVEGRARGRIFGATDTDLFQFVPPVDMLGEYGGEPDMGMPPNWAANDRPSSRLQIMVEGDGPGSVFFNGFVRVYDSNLNLVFMGNDNIFVPVPPWADPAGMYDPSAWPAELDLMLGSDREYASGSEGIEVWGGEVYYIEVSSSAIFGRYQMSVVVDALADDVDDDEIYDDLISTQLEVTNADNYTNAVSLDLFDNSGDGSNFVPGAAAYNGRFFPPSASGIRRITQSDLAGIERIGDSDLYQFRAPRTGTVEIRIATTGIADEYFEQHRDVNMFDMVVFETEKQKTYNSPLDSVLRVFNNDREQVAYNDDNFALGGATDTTTVGQFASKVFHRRDARVVVPIVQGQIYFIQVESGQFYKDGAPADPGDRVLAQADEIDWRHTTGSYELLFHTMPNLAFDDDHENTNPDLATVLGFDQRDDGTSDTIAGIVRDTNNNPDDVDLFTFIAPGTGVATVTVTRTSGAMTLDVVVFDATLTAIAQRIDTGGAGSVTLQVPASQGDRLFVQVNGANTGGVGVNNGYRLTVSGLAYGDDHASDRKFFDATEIEMVDFLGVGTAAGVIETPGDTDVFKITPLTFDFLRVDVDATSATLNPFVRVYEVSEDPAGNPVLLQVAFNDNASGMTLDSLARFSVNTDRVSGQTGNEYPFYYLVVSGVDAEGESGGYTISVTGVNTDDHPDADEFGQIRPEDGIAVDPASGLGAGMGNLELVSDSDLFLFIAPAGGFASVLIATPSSGLNPVVLIFNASTGAPVPGGGGADVGGTGQIGVSFQVARGQAYFIVVDSVPGLVETGIYTVGITAPTVDDHPNITEFPIATGVVISPETGVQSANGLIETLNDTDLFTFTTISTGNVTISVVPAANSLARVRIFRADQTALSDSAATTPGQGVSATITSAPIGTVYYVLVSFNAGAGAADTGGYTVFFDGPLPPLDDDHPDRNRYDQVGPNDTIALSTVTGDGSGTGLIETAGDQDLFRFTSLASGRAFVQVVTAGGSGLDASVRVYDDQGAIVIGDAPGVPGASADAEFNTLAVGRVYFVEVIGDGGAGAYTVRVDTAPATHFLYFPEGFSGSAIREFVSIANPNAGEVEYTVILRYERGERDQVLETGRIAGMSRGGLTISNGPEGTFPGVRTDEPYAIVIESNGPLGATLAHYDFGFSLGESFTERTSATWAFARAERVPGLVFDFLVFYNPNLTDTIVTMTAYAAGQAPVTLSTVVGGLRRGGWNLNDTAALPVGTFGLVVTSAPADPSDGHIGIVASLSHYDTADQEGFSVLGGADGGATEGIIPSVTEGTSISSEFTFFNPGATPATVRLVGSYIVAGFPGLDRTVTVEAGSTATLTGEFLALVQNQPIGIRYSSDVPVAALFTESRTGDASGTSGVTEVGQNFFFGDAFINSAEAGSLYLESLTFYNPAQSAISIDIAFLFSNGDQETTALSVGPDSFGRVDLHALDLIIERPGLNFFSIVVSSNSTFAAYMSHYDLFLNGGWGTQGAPLGLLNPLATV